MTVFRPPVYDDDGQRVRLSDVAPIEPGRTHDRATCEVDGCWACRWLADNYGCLGCGDVLAEGHWCRSCKRRAA